MDKDKRIAELEQAIRDANANLAAGEGIDLLYWWFNDTTTDKNSKKVIEEILQHGKSTKV